MSELFADSVRLPETRVLSKAAVSRQFELKEQGDTQARDGLIEYFMPLASGLASRYGNKPPLSDDLAQVAFIGLINSVDRFDRRRGVAFSSFATPYILGEIKKYFRGNWGVHVPRELQERSSKVRNVIRELEQDGNWSVNDVAEQLSITPEEVDEALHAGSNYQTFSLDKPAPWAKSDGDDPPSVIETVSDTQSGDDYERADEKIDAAARVHGVDRVLSERSRMIFKLRFEDDLSQNEIADRVGISQMHVSRLLRKSMPLLAIMTAEA